MNFSKEEMSECKAEMFTLLDACERDLRSMNSGTDFHRLFDSVARCLNKLKGNVGLIGFPKLEKNFHELETAFSSFKTADSIPDSYVRLFLRGIEAFRKLLVGSGVNLTEPLNDSQGSDPMLIQNPSSSLTPTIVSNSGPGTFSDLVSDPISDLVSDTVSGLVSDPISDLISDTVSELVTDPISDLVSDTVSGLVSDPILDSIPDSKSTLSSEPALSKSQQPSESTRAAVVEFVAECEEIIDRVFVTLQKFESHPEAKSSIDTLCGDVHDNLMALIGEMVVIRNQILKFPNKSEELEFPNERIGSTVDLANAPDKGTTSKPNGLEDPVADIEITKNYQGTAKLGNLLSAGAKYSEAAQLTQILVVDDAQCFRRAISGLLEKVGYNVTTATDGKQAVDLLNQGNTKFDLIVSDIEMPRMNGFELARAVRSHEVYASIPLVAISRRTDDKSLQEAESVGFNAYLEKLKPAILLESVAELVHLKEKTA